MTNTQLQIRWAKMRHYAHLWYTENQLRKMEAIRVENESQISDTEFLAQELGINYENEMTDVQFLAKELCLTEKDKNNFVT